jgi:hypothetical protein
MSDLDSYQPYNGIHELDIYAECHYQCRSSIMRQYIELYPEALAKANEAGDLLLHLLLWNEASSVDDALLMIETYPAALQHQDRYRYLPIHIECEHRCRSAIIARCINLYPEALTMANESSDLPLHMLLLGKFSCLDLVLTMIEKYPAAVKHQNSRGYLPIHIECSYRCRSTLILKCIELYPESLGVVADLGKLPLHFLLWNEPPCVEIALRMIEEYPAALKHRNYIGHLPIHVECRTLCRSSILSKCIELYPDSLDERAIINIFKKINKSNISKFLSVLIIVFTARPMSLYEHYPNLNDDIRQDPYYRRRILHLLPHRVFTPTHESDYRDLNWQSRASMIMLLSQMKIQQVSCRG